MRLGSGVEYDDAPAIRKIVAGVRDDNYRFSRLIVGHCSKHAVSDEDVEMNIMKKALAAADIPARNWRGARASAARCHGSVVDGPRRNSGQPGSAATAGLRLYADGMRCDSLDSARSDTLDELSPSLSPLAPVKKNVTIITNLELRNAYPGTHATSNASFLSAAKAKRTESTDYHLGTTVDQIAARQIGSDTQLPSLELSMDLLSVVGQCDNGYACVYQNNLSWSSPTTPLPAEAHPRIVFENLFGEEGGAAERRRRSRSGPVCSIR